MLPQRAIVLAVCGFSAWWLTACGGSERGTAEAKAALSAQAQPAPPTGTVVLAPDAPELKEITIETVRAIPLPSDEVSAPARIEANPNRVAHALMPVPGRIVKVMAKLGDGVWQGQPLVEIESPAAGEAEAANIQAEASVRQAELAAVKADTDLARLVDLFEHQAVAQKEVIAAKTAASLSKASLEQAESVREQARGRLEVLGLRAGKFQQQVTVRAPISGKVLDLSVVEGEYRNEINTPLITIADLRRVWATSEVPESKIRYCKLGGTADLELIAYPSETFRARVTRIADTVDRDTRTIKVSAELDNESGRLRPEMFGNLRYADGIAPASWVPDSAVVRIGDKDFVFLEQERGRFLSSPVELGRRHDGGFAVAKGVKPGDRIVTQGSVYLKAAL